MTFTTPSIPTPPPVALPFCLPKPHSRGSACWQTPCASKRWPLARACASHGRQRPLSTNYKYQPIASPRPDIKLPLLQTLDEPPETKKSITNHQPPQVDLSIQPSSNSSTDKMGCQCPSTDGGIRTYTYNAISPPPSSSPTTTTTTTTTVTALGSSTTYISPTPTTTTTSTMTVPAGVTFNPNPPPRTNVTVTRVVGAVAVMPALSPLPPPPPAPVAVYRTVTAAVRGPAGWGVAGVGWRCC